MQSARHGTFLTALLTAQTEIATILENTLTRFKAPPVGQGDYLMALHHSRCRPFATALAQ